MKLKRTRVCSKLNSFMHAGVLAAGLAISGCSEQALNTFIQPYKGEIDKDKNGEYFQANTILITASNISTKEDIERIIRPYGGEIFGWLKISNIFMIFLPKDQRDRAMQELPKNPEVISTELNYYYRNFSDNDQLAADNSKYSCANWFKTISLSGGLDLLQNRPLQSVVIAVIEVDRFDTKNPQIPYVDEKYHGFF